MDELFIPLDVDYADSRKMAQLARFGVDARPARDLFVQMVCYCKRKKTDGKVPVEMVGKLAYPDPLDVAERQVKMLAEVELIEPDGDAYWTIPSYLQRNPSRADIDARRQHLAEVGSESGSWGNHKRWHLDRGRSVPACPHCSGAPDRVASGSHRVDPNRSNRTETETETETITTSTARETRGTRITNDWKPTAALVEWQRGQGISDLLARRELPKFIDFWLGKAGQAGLKRDWPATWRNWLRTAAEREARPPAASAGGEDVPTW